MPNKAGRASIGLLTVALFATSYCLDRSAIGRRRNARYLHHTYTHHHGSG